MLSLNARAARLCRELVEKAQEFRIAAADVQGTTVIDCGIETPGGLEAGRRLAEICMGGLAQVWLAPGEGRLIGPQVCVSSDHPLHACMFSQYAGWQVQHDSYFAMGSGPMRAAAAKEELFETLDYRESPEMAVGVLETRRFPPADVCQSLAESCGVSRDRLTLLVAPTASLAGHVQVVARSLETALHKLHELEFDLTSVVSGFGSAPLPPLGADDLASLGRTNDAVLYGGNVTLWVSSDDKLLRKLGPQVPSSSSRDYGLPFWEVFEHAGRDFYQVDPMLFSPARVTFINVATGNSFRFGLLAPDVLRKSFATISYA